MDNRRCDYTLLGAIAARLRALRKERNLSQQLVYIDTDIHIGKIELGKTNIAVNTLAALCHYYGVTLTDFFVDVERLLSEQTAPVAERRRGQP